MRIRMYVCVSVCIPIYCLWLVFVREQKKNYFYYNNQKRVATRCHNIIVKNNSFVFLRIIKYVNCNSFRQKKTLFCLPTDDNDDQTEIL